MSDTPDLPSTELPNPASVGIDSLSTRDVLGVIHGEDRRAWEAIEPALDSLAELIDDVVRAFRGGGRLLYFGAGTSGRLGVLDASECPPTFGVPPELVVGRIAGGDGALRDSVEGAEDDVDAGRAEAADAGVGARDVVCGIAASGTTPFVQGALREARDRGAVTALLHCNPRLRVGSDGCEVDHAILLDVGPEVVAGSTRLKSGTATKMALNMITTTAMIRRGKVFDNLMVDVQPTNRKLVRRATRLVARLGEVSEEEAHRLLAEAGREVKVAIVMARAAVDADVARKHLRARDDSLRETLRSVGATAPRPGDGGSNR